MASSYSYALKRSKLRRRPPSSPAHGFFVQILFTLKPATFSSNRRPRQNSTDKMSSPTYAEAASRCRRSITMVIVASMP